MSDSVKAGRMSTGTAAQLDSGYFGLSGASLTLNPDATPDDLAFDLLALIDNALAVFHAIGSTGDENTPPHPLHHAGMHPLLQARILAERLQMTTQQGAAVLAAGRLAS